MKGIVLAGGAGTRLHPTTKAVNKHLLPVYDKPMIYYPISTLKQSGITDIMIITTPDDMDTFYRLLGTGEEFGLNFFYETQDKPRGIADAFNVASEWIGSDSVTLILGDNVFYGDSLINDLIVAQMRTDDFGHAHIFPYKVRDPQRYGVVEYDEDSGKLVRIVEKPKEYISDFAVIGLYVYPPGVADMVSTLKPSARGELEITDLNNLYIEEGNMGVEIVSESNAWLDTGTHDSLIEASMFVKTLQDRINVNIGDIS